MHSRWKSMWMGTLAAVAIAILAGIVMDRINPGVGARYSSSSTRL